MQYENLILVIMTFQILKWDINILVAGFIKMCLKKI